MTVSIRKKIKVRCSVNLAIAEVWKLWTEEEHLSQWYSVGEEWQITYLKNEVRGGSKCKITLSNGCETLSFGNIYTCVIKEKRIEYYTLRKRKIRISFSEKGNYTTITKIIETSDLLPLQTEKKNWQLIMNKFKKYAEENFLISEKEFVIPGLEKSWIEFLLPF